MAGVLCGVLFVTVQLSLPVSQRPPAMPVVFDLCPR
jgi:hypothetical protein